MHWTIIRPRPILFPGNPTLATLKDLIMPSVTLLPPLPPLPEALPTLTPRAFDLRLATPFCERSLSPETRRAYRRVVAEFFRFCAGSHPADILPADVLRWRDGLVAARKSAATVAFKLSVVRSLFDYLQLAGYVTRNPALSKLVPPPAVPEDLRGRALSAREVRCLLSGPDRAEVAGARDYALLLLLLRTSLRVAEACSLRRTSLKASGGQGTLRVKVKGGRERALPLPDEVRAAVNHYLQLDAERRRTLHSDGPDAFIFQPLVNYRTLVFAKPLSTTMAWHIVRKWAGLTGLGLLSPHDLRRTAITRALDQGLSLRQVQMMSGHRDPKTVMRYDHHRENLAHSAINFLDYAAETEL